MAKAKECCETCKYWTEQRDGKGPCRYKPPVVVFNHDPMPGEDPIKTVWPQTQMGEWCGNFVEFDEETDVEHGDKDWVR